MQRRPSETRIAMDGSGITDEEAKVMLSSLSVLPADGVITAD